MSIVLIVIVILFHLNTADANARDFLLYGNVELRMENKHCSCEYKLAVQIGSHNWQQPLKWRFYAFKVPQNLAIQSSGILSLEVYKQNECIKSLWRGYFLIREGAAQRLDITTSVDQNICACVQSPPEQGKTENLERKEEAYALVLVLAGDIMPVISPRPSHLNSRRASVCQCPQKPMIPMLPGTGTDDSETLRQIARLWRVLLVAFAGARFMICWLTHNETREWERRVECRRAGDGERKRWEMSLSCLSNRNRKKNTNERWMALGLGVLVSGEGRYEEALADAEHHLGKVELDCCFCFNSTRLNTGFTPAPVTEGPWNRDSHGRLTR